MSDVTPGGERSWVKLDRYAIDDIGRRFDLTDIDRWMLVTLVRCADYRSAKWTGTLTQLAEDAAMDPRTARRALNRLEACGLLRTVRRFGRNRLGVILVLAYPDMRVASSKVDREVDEQVANALTDDTPNARRTHADYTPNAKLPVSQLLTSEDGASRGREEGGSEEVMAIEPARKEDVVEHELEVEPCESCFAPSTLVDDDGHAFCDDCRKMTEDPRRFTR